jgi:hypothetical protein
MTARFVLRWFFAFVLTQSVEIPIYRRMLKQGVWASFGASAMTHPLVWLFLSSHLWHASWPLQVAVVELLVWFAEAAYFRFAIGARRSLSCTFVANASSFTAGLVAQALLG